MIAQLRLSAVRPFRLHLPVRLRAALPGLAWGARWLGLGLALGAAVDLAVRLSLPG